MLHYMSLASLCFQHQIKPYTSVVDVPLLSFPLLFQSPLNSKDHALLPPHDVTQETELRNCLQKVCTSWQATSYFTYMPKQQSKLQLLLEIGIFMVVTRTQKPF